MMRYSVLISTLSLLSGYENACATLSTPHVSDTTGARADGIAAMADQIKNEKRWLPIGNEMYPLFTGPIPYDGSLSQQLLYSEATTLTEFGSDLPMYMAGLSFSLAPNLTSLPEIASIYESATDFAEVPMSTDISDVNFGRQRLTVAAMRMRQVWRSDTWKDFQLTDGQLEDICGYRMKWENIVRRKSLFVEDFSDAAQWNDPETVNEKYVPNVVGFFCYNRPKRQLLPIEIRFKDTGLAYTPLDSAQEWTLAKMGLNAAMNSYHQMQHYAETHALAIPMRVELYRNMAAIHPIRVLLDHHFKLDLGLELALSIVLLTPGTPYDETFGWGATGSARFINHQLTGEISAMYDLPTDLKTRGLNGIREHMYAAYGRKLYRAISRFASGYVDAYYRSDAEIAADFELQNWARACAKVPHLYDFPASIKTRPRLIQLLSHLISLKAVKHHAMNGKATWHMLSVPYSPTALWKALPTHKLAPEETIDLMEYALPVDKLHLATGLAGSFYRIVPESETLPSAYKSAPFSTEPCLKNAIAKFESDLARIDKYIEHNEAHEEFPYDLLRPTVLPYYTWV